jgi:hypothetical protein
MNDDVEIARRAYRMAGWYPRAWRQRYGAEFVDLMEQEFTDIPHSFRRTSNIMYKGIVARLREIGLVASPLNSNDQARPAIATIFVVAAVFLAFASNFWSVAMLGWNQDWRNPASTAVTIWTGAVTVLTGIVVALVVANLLALLWSATRRVIKGQKVGRIRGPLSIALAAAVFLGFSLHNTFRFLASRGAIVWTHPGQAIKLIAGTVQVTASTVLSVWMSPREALTVDVNILYGLIPVALVAFALSVAALVRRTEFSAPVIRFVQYELLILAPAMFLFVVAYFGLMASGHSALGFGQPLSYPPLEIEFGVMTFMAVIGMQAANRLLRNEILAWRA